MTKKVTAATVRREYQKQIETFVRCIADPALKLQVLLSADNYFRQCAVCVWGHAGPESGPVTEAHVTAYNAIASKGSAVGNALYFQVFSQVNDQPQFKPPVFFGNLLESDRNGGGRLTENFIRVTGVLLLLFAAVDDRVTQTESDYADACTQYLRALAAGEVPVQPKAPSIPTENPVPASQQATGESSSPKAAAEAETQEAQAPQESTEELLAELDSLVGLEQVKKDVRSLINLVKVRKLREEMELPVPPMSLHMVFMGNPGTGKTTVARLMAKLYHAIGVLSKGQLVEVDRSGLVAGYVGQTATKTQAVITSALGGVLFIDEAYSLTSHQSENDFGQEAVEVLLKNMEDHRKDLVVIVAGYTALMGDFIHSNPGLESRFNKYMYFEDYNGQQLWEIFASLCKKNGYVPSQETEDYAKSFFRQLFEERDENFGNARDVRNIFEKLVSAQSDRVSQLEAPTREALMEVTLADFRSAVDEETPENEES